VKRVTLKIPNESPRLEELSSEALEKRARVVVAEDRKEELRATGKLEKIDYSAERTRIFASAS
jgi:hypothetical protein